MTSISNTSAGEFAEFSLPLYHGPTVKIQIIVSGHEYVISKAILCNNSPYFTETLECKLEDGEPQTIYLEEAEGVVSDQSVQALIQWLYLGKVNLQYDLDEPEDRISATIELVRLADMYSITGIEFEMARYIKNILVSNPMSDYYGLHERPKDANTFCLTHQHIASVAFLPRNHLVRRLIAAASVEGYLRHGSYKFEQATKDYPSFGSDLLREVKAALDGSIVRMGLFEDPISGLFCRINSSADVLSRSNPPPPDLGWVSVSR